MQVASQPVWPGPRPEAGGEGDRRPAGRRPGAILWRRFRRDRLAVAGLLALIVMSLLAAAAPLAGALTGHGPNEVFPERALNPRGLPVAPEPEFWFGADTAGGDLFVRVLYGGRTSLTVALLATGISLVIGVALGTVSGYFRGRTDAVVSHLIDVVLSLPVLFLALGLAAACGLGEGCLGGLIRPGIVLVSLIIGLFSWPYVARLVRGQVLSLREREFVEAARAQGAGDVRIMAREILPNVAAPIIVYAALVMPTNILFEAALSFLGVGTPATTPSWGRMISEASTIFTYAWWMMLFPGLFLFVTTLAFNLVGDGLRDALDPRAV